MKTNIFKLMVVASLIATTGCNDFLDVNSKSEFAEDVVFSKEETSAGMINGIYHYFGEETSYRSRMLAYMGINTDIELQSSSADAKVGDQDRRSLAVYLQNAGLSDGFNKADGKDPWSVQFAAIEHCNLCISGIEKYGNPQPGNRMGELLGEALTMRAFFYFDLIKYWGDVPARFEPLTSKDLFLPKSDRTVIYDQIIADLERAENLLPWPGEGVSTNTVERPSKAFAKGLRARIALSAAGKALVRQDRNNIEGGDAGVIDYVFADEAKRAELMQIVKSECEQVIAKNCNPLADDYEQIWKDVMNDETSIGRESMFEIGFKSTRGQHSRLMGALCEGANKYATVDIKPYVYASPTLFYDYNQADSRRDVTVLPYKYVVKSSKLTTGDTKNGFQDISDITKMSFGKYRSSYRDVSKNGKLEGSDFGINFPVMRSADLYLMLAEAVNELEGPANAKQYLQTVRNRAFHAQDGRFDLISYDINTKEGFLKAIQDERKFEFANELVRKQDLIRWGILKQSMDQARTDARDLREGTGKYANVHKSIYYRLKNSEELEIKGLNSDDDVEECTEANGWIEKVWASEESTNASTNIKEQRLSDTWIQSSYYQGDPDKRQLLPIVSIIIESSNGKLKNDFGY